ncbi:CopG family transcriptional regulator [Thiocystis violacea]|uniref:CopG family transcriptional regulator n=1 Tax=Thiocystis violacea TaxID=13725 RepID=UPI001903E2DC|nr:CopG family transcriptional regulator [Thiocystis violacea]MBK1717368.1 hypothetical protein [Thiocystis violacea]
MAKRTAPMRVPIDSRNKRIFECLRAQPDLASSRVIREPMSRSIIEPTGARERPEWLTAGAAGG